MNSEVNPNRYVPACMNGHMDFMENGNCEVFYTTTNENSGNKFYAIAYVGKRKDSVWHYQFSTQERMEAKIAEFIDNQKAIQTSKKERKAKQKEANAAVTCNVGDLFCSSGGYDQTNLSFYQVIEVKNKTAKLKEIGSKIVKGSEGFMCCNMLPNKDNFLNEKIYTKRIQASYDGSPYFADMYWGNAYHITENTSKYCSWYA